MQIQKKLTIAAVITLLSLSTSSLAIAKAPTQLYSEWNSALKTNVDQKGLVSYKRWQKNQTELNKFLNKAKSLNKSQYAQMNRDERIAFWINVYNAFTIKQILDHYPIKRSGFNFIYPSSSIRQIDGVWTKFKVRAAGRTVSLSDIENKILRDQFDEPLIHFAINCASKSCPRLQNTAYQGSKLKLQLDKAVKDFLQDKTRNQISAKELRLSKIFDWYKSDFEKHYLGKKKHPGKSTSHSAILNFLSVYKLSSHASISFMPYDWSLNERKN